MSTITHPESTKECTPSVAGESHGPSASSWNTLCACLTRDVRGMMAVIERREGDGEWVVECTSCPLESVTTHVTANGVRVISVSIRKHRGCKVFTISGPNSIVLRRNAAGWPVRVELGYQEGRLVLLFSGEVDPQKKSSSNAWGE